MKMNRKTHIKILIAVLSIPLLLVIWGFLIEPGLLIENKQEKLKWPGPPLRIVFFSDLHAGAPHISEIYIQNLITRMNSYEPDLILIGGDLVINGVIGGSHISIEKLAPWLKKLKARHGVYSVLGNHDWWNGGELIRRNLESQDITVLDNESKTIQINDDFSFSLIGIGDDYTEHADPEKAFKTVPLDSLKIVFMHDPSAIFKIKESYFLSFAGHMHGGQIYLPGYGALITPGSAPREWAKGWIDFPMGSVFVTQGVGTSIIPVRLNAPPEFVILDLKP